MIDNQPIPDSIDLFEPTYLVTLDEIYHSQWVSRRRRRIKYLREAIADFWPNGHPSKLIHVTGTNGKGSVIHYMEQGFKEKTGSWTGPHVFDYAERFHIDCKIVPHEEITEIYREILLPYQDQFMETHSGDSLTFAELGILIALHLYDKHKVTWGMMEVGNGGRYCPLMALDVVACILTNVGDDHPQTLGTELWQRALEKSGIARPGIPFFTSAEAPALSLVCKAAEAENAILHTLKDEDINALGNNTHHDPPFKRRNQALACKVIQYFDPSFNPALRKMNAHLTARFLHVTPNIIADVAHNVNKISKLTELLTTTYPGKKFCFILGLSRSRDVREVFAPLLPIAQRIVFTSASYAGQNPASLAGHLKNDFPEVETIPDPSTAYQKEKERLKENEILVLTGSAYMIDQALNPNPFLRHTNATFGRRTIDASGSQKPF